MVLFDRKNKTHLIQQNQTGRAEGKELASIHDAQSFDILVRESMKFNTCIVMTCLFINIDLSKANAHVQ